ncbi:hypothetical protein GALL_476710 [mine drainage metagenome]|uniref:Uncharacterized protein n=1 Tax=mine drainage metagenome TaxID=410659 RepID=A0A1J5PZK4_9ZZZZ
MTEKIVVRARARYAVLSRAAVKQVVGVSGAGQNVVASPPDGEGQPLHMILALLVQNIGGIGAFDAGAARQQGQRHRRDRASRILAQCKSVHARRVRRKVVERQCSVASYCGKSGLSVLQAGPPAQSDAVIGKPLITFGEQSLAPVLCERVEYIAQISLGDEDIVVPKHPIILGQHGTQGCHVSCTSGARPARIEVRRPDQLWTDAATDRVECGGAVGHAGLGKNVEQCRIGKAANQNRAVPAALDGLA